MNWKKKGMKAMQTNTIVIPKNSCLEKPIEIHCAKESCYEIIVEENAQGTIIETSNNAEAHSSQINIILHKNAQLFHYKKYLDNTTVTSQLSVKQKEKSQFFNHILCNNSEKISSEIHVHLEEEYAECKLIGVTVGKDKQQIEHRTVIEHLKPHCTSDQYYKAILDDKAKSSFHGKVIVAPNAIKTQANQNNKTLLLSRAAEINTQPELEIFSDDVKCTHGATVGQLDEEALFYLQARGINKAEAQSLLVDAFLSDVLEI